MSGVAALAVREASESPVAPAPALGVDTKALDSWLSIQAVNSTRHAAALRPFRKDEFGTGPASPSDAHIEAANALTGRLRERVQRTERAVVRAAAATRTRAERGSITDLLRIKDAALDHVKQTEDIWKFYFELFGQRQSRFGPHLLACDRIALDCYQFVYTGLGRTKPIPSPAPFCYMETGFSPATFRRGVRIGKLGRHANPFPLIQLPYHRLVNPWTLGAVLHEAAHNLQSDLGLWQVMPFRIAQRLLQAGVPHNVIRVWARWHKETWADVCAVLLGGPAIVTSLMDVVARAPAGTLHFAGSGVHPTPYLRVLINVELLHRMGLTEDAETVRRNWLRLYPNPGAGSIPDVMLSTFPLACRLVVDTMAFSRFEQLGGKSLADAVKFEPKDQGMVAEAGRRLARSRDPGIIPAIYLIGAARWALDRALARPDVIANNFYRALVRR
jgi:hypothetical protein